LDTITSALTFSFRRYNSDRGGRILNCAPFQPTLFCRSTIFSPRTSKFRHPLTKKFQLLWDFVPQTTYRGLLCPWTTLWVGLPSSPERWNSHPTDLLMVSHSNLLLCSECKIITIESHWATRISKNMPHRTAFLRQHGFCLH